MVCVSKPEMQQIKDSWQTLVPVKPDGCHSLARLWTWRWTPDNSWQETKRKTFINWKQKTEMLHALSRTKKKTSALFLSLYLEFTFRTLRGVLIRMTDTIGSFRPCLFLIVTSNRTANQEEWGGPWENSCHVMFWHRGKAWNLILRHLQDMFRSLQCFWKAKKKKKFFPLQLPIVIIFPVHRLFVPGMKYETCKWWSNNRAICIGSRKFWNWISLFGGRIPALWNWWTEKESGMGHQLSNQRWN